jgi:hypothetical protein
MDSPEGIRVKDIMKIKWLHCIHKQIQNREGGVSDTRSIVDDKVVHRGRRNI